MSLTSVLGKKWVLRKFNNEDINFFKENFFLDTTVSKLLSIRGIPKNEVELFASLIRESTKKYDSVFMLSWAFPPEITWPMALTNKNHHGCIDILMRI